MEKFLGKNLVTLSYKVQSSGQKTINCDSELLSINCDSELLSINCDSKLLSINCDSELLYSTMLVTLYHTIPAARKGVTPLGVHSIFCAEHITQWAESNIKMRYNLVLCKVANYIGCKTIFIYFKKY